MDANRAEAERCVEIARRHAHSGAKDKATKFVDKAKRLYPDIEIDAELLKATGAQSGGAKKDNMGESSHYGHFDDNYNDEDNSNVRSRRSKFHASQSQPSFAAGEGPSSSSHGEQNGAPRSSNRSRTRSVGGGQPKLGIDYTQEEVEMVQRIRHCKDYYEILNVQKDFADAQLKKEYRRMALQLHPDKCRAPHATEAFKALGNAYAVLSDAEKRRRYDMYGTETPSVQRRRRDSNDYFEHGFQAEFTPEEIFNMFFGGGYPTGAMHRQQRRQPRPEHHHHYEFHQQDAPGYGPLIQLLPLLAIFLLGIVGQLMVGDPAFSLHRNNKYTLERVTSDLSVPYYVKPDFLKTYQGRIQQVEHQVEDEYVSNLRMACYRERSQKETLMWRARTFGDSGLWERAQNLNMPNCDKLQRMYG